MRTLPYVRRVQREWRRQLIATDAELAELAGAGESGSESEEEQGPPAYGVLEVRRRGRWALQAFLEGIRAAVPGLAVQRQAWQQQER